MEKLDLSNHARLIDLIKEAIELGKEQAPREGTDWLYNRWYYRVRRYPDRFGFVKTLGGVYVDTVAFWAWYSEPEIALKEALDFLHIKPIATEQGKAVYDKDAARILAYLYRPHYVIPAQDIGQPIRMLRNLKRITDLTVQDEWGETHKAVLLYELNNTRLLPYIARRKVYSDLESDQS